MDNWEWVSHYRPASRHGLFSVDRRTPEQPRCMTDAGIALAHLVAAGGLGRARERFGTFRADGTAVRQPSMSAGRLYAGQLTAGEHTQPFELYLSTRTDQSLLGLLYYGPADGALASDAWVALPDPQVAQGRLTFRHGPVPGRVVAASYVLAPGADAVSIGGQATVGGTVWQVAGHLQPLGLYTMPTPAQPPPDRAIPPGTVETSPAQVRGSGWAPLIITRYQHNSGLSNARQLLDSWVHRDCPPEGGILTPGEPLTLTLLPAEPPRPGRRPAAAPQRLTFTGGALVSPAGEMIFARAPDGVEL
jgi:hypothetical protein